MALLARVLRDEMDAALDVMEGVLSLVEVVEARAREDAPTSSRGRRDARERRRAARERKPKPVPLPVQRAPEVLCGHCGVAWSDGHDCAPRGD